LDLDNELQSGQVSPLSLGSSRRWSCPSPMSSEQLSDDGDEVLSRTAQLSEDIESVDFGDMRVFGSGGWVCCLEYGDCETLV
jgi:hypothetical protein